jgi:hypothetical protein
MSERRALVVGIDAYEDVSLGLLSAVKDAQEVADQLRFHADGALNYDCRLLVAHEAVRVNRAMLLSQLDQLFSHGFDGDALFYFSGHGVVSRSGGRLYKLRFCPPQGGVLFIQPVADPNAGTPPGGGYLRSESDENCEAPACPVCPDKPGACWAAEFSEQTVAEIWIR